MICLILSIKHTLSTINLSVDGLMPETKFYFNHLILLGWHARSFKANISKCCWQRFVSFIIFFLVPFRTCNNKSVPSFSGIRNFAGNVLLIKTVFTYLCYLWPYLQVYHHANCVILSMVEEDRMMKPLIGATIVVFWLELPSFAHIKQQVWNVCTHLMIL